MDLRGHQITVGRQALTHPHKEGMPAQEVRLQEALIHGEQLSKVTKCCNCELRSWLTVFWQEINLCHHKLPWRFLAEGMSSKTERRRDQLLASRALLQWVLQTLKVALQPLRDLLDHLNKVNRASRSRDHNSSSNNHSSSRA